MLVSIALLSSGCTGPLVVELPQPAQSRPPATIAPLIDGRCRSYGAGLLPPIQTGRYVGSLPPKGFEPLTVVRCTDDGGRQTADGFMTYVIEERSADLSPDLTTALRLPDTGFPGSAGGHLACPANESPYLFLLLVDVDGRGYEPRVPIDWCGVPRPEVLAAVDAASWRQTHRFEVVRPAR